jgi:hypothetical protein
MTILVIRQDRYDAKPDRKRESGAEQRKCRIAKSAGSLVVRLRKCSRGGGHEENEHQVRHHANDATPGGIPKVPRRTNKAFGPIWGTGRQTAERMALVAKDFQPQTQWALAAMSAPIYFAKMDGSTESKSDSVDRQACPWCILSTGGDKNTCL